MVDAFTAFVNTDNELRADQIGIDYKLQKRLGIDRREHSRLEIASRAWPYRMAFWMNHPDDRVRVPLVVGTVLAVGLFFLSLIPTRL